MFLPFVLLLLSTGTKPTTTSRLPHLVRLEISTSTTLEVPSFGSFGDAQADEDGNLFFHAATRHYLDSVVLGVYAKKSQPVVFALPDDFAKSTAFAAFSVTRSGKVYIAAEDRELKARPRVFSFDDDGQLSSQTELETPKGVRVKTLSIFDRSGNMFVAGYYDSSALPAQRGRSYVALVTPSGKVLRELRNGDTIDLKKVGDIPNESSSYVADDGNLYLLAGNKIRVLQESGQLLRTLHLSKPSQECFATKVIVSQGIAAVWLDVNPKEGQTVQLNFETIDVSTGHILSLYYPEDELGNKAVNFTRQDGFTFLDSDKGRVRLFTAAAH
ncbi:MAG: hypothetical protein LAO03_13000 [Acidobacteriia bacterium]|nr:hypothetical protein [Terriglobia bacterium]